MKTKISQESPDTENCEIIEAAIDEIDLLTRAFLVIQEVCDEANASFSPLGIEPPERLVN